MIDGGPALKRIRFRGKGGVGAIKKPTSHITVIVSGEVKTKKVAEKATVKEATETKSETKEESHKLEVEHPDTFKKETVKPTTTKSANKMFRRKTG